MTAIELQGLTKRYGEKTVVDNLSFSIEQGELLALLGVNGAGKTTTIKMLSGLLPPTAGDAVILGKSITREAHTLKGHFGLSPQETAVAPGLSVGENLEFMAGIYGFSREEAKARAGKMLADFGLEAEAKSRAKNLSGGQQRRLSIAMALITDPQVLFLDEPTLGLDILARRELWHSVEALKGKVTMILTTHYLEEAEALSDRVAVMAKGKLRAIGTAGELIAQTGAKNFEDAFVALAAGEGDNR